jgi:hypothetical protein
MASQNSPDGKLKVSVSEAQELIKSIRILAQNGKESFIRHLYDPLHREGWRASQHNQSTRKLMEKIASEANDPSFLHTIAPRCKRLIGYAMDETLPVLGDAAIFFLEKMQLHAKISSSPESVEFAAIINPSLSDFLAKSSDKNEQLFRAAISNIDAAELKTALEPVRIDATPEKVKLDSEIKRLYDNIFIASKYNNIPKCRKLLSNYIISYSDADDYARNDVDRLIEALNKRESTFDYDVKNMIAIELHYRITKAILGGDLRLAVRCIRKYGYIFEGNSATAHFYDIDRLERILYQMISEKDLWDDMKK